MSLETKSCRLGEDTSLHCKARYRGQMRRISVHFLFFLTEYSGNCIFHSIYTSRVSVRYVNEQLVQHFTYLKKLKKKNFGFLYKKMCVFFRELSCICTISTILTLAVTLIKSFSEFLIKFFLIKIFSANETYINVSFSEKIVFIWKTEWYVWRYDIDNDFRVPL